MPLFNIHNPTMARRVIYDGSLQQVKITVNPGETKYAVEIQPHIAAGFSDGRDGRKDDLWLMPTETPPPVQAPPPPAQQSAPAAPTEVKQPIPEQGLPQPPPQMPGGYRRYQAPLIEDPIEKAIADEAAADEERAEAVNEDKPRKRAKVHARKKR